MGKTRSLFSKKLPKLKENSKENSIELEILDFLNLIAHQFAWKNPSSGYFDTVKKCFRRHSNPYAINGTPDIYCQIKGYPSLKGVVVHFEVKSKTGKPSPDQLIFQSHIAECEGYYFVVRSLEDVVQALRGMGLEL